MVVCVCMAPSPPWVGGGGWTRFNSFQQPCLVPAPMPTMPPCPLGPPWVVHVLGVALHPSHPLRAMGASQFLCLPHSAHEPPHWLVICQVFSVPNLQLFGAGCSLECPLPAHVEFWKPVSSVATLHACKVAPAHAVCGRVLGAQVNCNPHESPHPFGTL